MNVEPASAAASRTHDAQTFYFCSDGCATTFDEDPGAFALKPAGEEANLVADPVCGMEADPASAPRHSHDGVTYYFCGEGCRSRFAADPEHYLAGAGLVGEH